MAFPNDGMRFQENEQRLAISAGGGRVRPLLHRDILTGF